MDKEQERKIMEYLNKIKTPQDLDNELGWDGKLIADELGKDPRINADPTPEELESLGPDFIQRVLDHTDMSGFED